MKKLKKHKKLITTTIISLGLSFIINYFWLVMSWQTIFVVFVIIEFLLLLFQYIPLDFKPNQKSRDDELVEAIEFVQNWWKYDMKTGEEFRIDDSEAYEIYIGENRYYAISIARQGVETKMFVLVGTNPLRVVNYLPYSSIYYSNPIEVIKDVFGVIPTPAPSKAPIPATTRKLHRLEPKPREKDELLELEQQEEDTHA